MTQPHRTALKLPLLLTAFAICTIAAAPSNEDEGGQPLSQADLYLELNDTDGDLGLHASIDGEPWTSLEIETPDDRTLLDIASRGLLKSQGMTQLFFESAEPDFEELSPKKFFRRFPEGAYHIEARAQDGGELVGTAMLSHILAAPPGNVLVSGVAPVHCQADVIPTVSAPVVISWDPVPTSHPELGRSGPIEVARYQLFVERPGVKLSIDLPPDVTTFEVPAGVTALGDSFKLEIIVRTATGNNTAIEACFGL